MRTPRELTAALAVAAFSIPAAVAGAGPVQASNRPATAVAVAPESDGVVEFDAATGAVIRVLTEVAEGEIGSVERGPDGTVYYSLLIGDSWEIHRLPASAGPPEVVGQGFAPAVSPDGGRLAYVHGPGVGSCAGDGIAVVDLATGRERRYPGIPGPDEPPSCTGRSRLRDLSWSPGSDRLVFQEYSHRDALHIFDPSTDGSVADAETLAEGHHWVAPAWLADGRIAVAEFPPIPQARVLTVDPGTGTAKPFAPGLTGFQGINDLDADPSGRHLLFFVSGAADSPSLFSVSEGAPPQEIRPPHGDVAW